MEKQESKKINYKLVIGKQGEEIAVSFLVKNGYRLLDRNYRAGRLGEIDIVASEDEYICFIEVKTRTGSHFGTPSESVGIKKQMKLRTLAWAYLKQHGLKDRFMRFDIVEVIVQQEKDKFVATDINLIKNAF